MKLMVTSVKAYFLITLQKWDWAFIKNRRKYNDAIIGQPHRNYITNCVNLYLKSTLLYYLTYERHSENYVAPKCNNYYISL